MTVSDAHLMVSEFPLQMTQHRNVTNVRTHENNQVFCCSSTYSNNPKGATCIKCRKDNRLMKEAGKQKTNKNNPHKVHLSLPQRINQRSEINKTKLNNHQPQIQTPVNRRITVKNRIWQEKVWAIMSYQNWFHSSCGHVTTYTLGPVFPMDL